MAQAQGQGRRGERGSASRNEGRPRTPSTEVGKHTVEHGDKKFVVRGIANHRGKAVEIVEFSHGRENRVVIPFDAIDKLFDRTEDVMDALEQNGEGKA